MKTSISTSHKSLVTIIRKRVFATCENDFCYIKSRVWDNHVCIYK